MKLYLSALSMFLLSACSSGDSDSNNTTKQVMPAGIWNGTSTDSNDNQTTVLGFIAADGTFYMTTDDDAVQVGVFEFDGEGLSTSITEYNDGSIYQGTIDATYTASQITATVSQSGNVLTNITLSLNADSELGASFSDIEGTYIDDNNYMSWVINGAGVITGSDLDNCQYNGNTSIQNNDINIYDFSVTLTGCDYAEDNGTYTGLATYTKENDTDTNKSFAIIFSNDESGNSLFLRK